MDFNQIPADRVVGHHRTLARAQELADWMDGQYEVELDLTDIEFPFAVVRVGA
jgi:hypothetical protein